MFLNQLETEEKKAFISLVVNAANANGIVEDEENQMIEDYCKEMGFPPTDWKAAKPMDEILNVFSVSSEQNKKIALLELIGLMYADGDYDGNERRFVKDFARNINISEEIEENIENVLIQYLEVTRKVYETVSNQ